MNQITGKWEMTILDAAAPAGKLDSLAIGDIDGDGRMEMVTGGKEAILWYRPCTGEHGTVTRGAAPGAVEYGVGIVLHDIDGDGHLEVVAGRSDYATNTSQICWFKMGSDITQPWTEHIIDPNFFTNHIVNVHDILFADVDGDGVDELVALYMYNQPDPGFAFFKKPADPTQLWLKHRAYAGTMAEGLNAADLDGDGQVEVILGPDWFKRPTAGAFSGLWPRMTYAAGFREMVRTALVDITGNGRPDVVMVESEYMDGRLSWFENRMVEDPAHPWVEHAMDGRFLYAHSLHAVRQGNTATFLLGEMDQGGWGAPRNWNARVLLYSSSDNGQHWTCETVDTGTGTHQALLADVDGDGLLEVVGKNPDTRYITIWHEQAVLSPIQRFKNKMLDRDKPDSCIDIIASDIDGDGCKEVLCGKWWYRNVAGGTRYEIPGIFQVINAADIDGDGREEIFAIKGNVGAPDFWNSLNAEMVWLKPIDPVNGIWEEHYIGTGTGNWPHSSFFAPIIPGGKHALVVGYHSAHTHYPEYFAMPDDPCQSPWPLHVLAEIHYGEEMAPIDLTGDGTLDIVAGNYWLENLGDGTFKSYQYADGAYPARLVVGDINNDGKVEVVIGEEVLDVEQRGFIPLSHVLWFRIPDDPRNMPWEKHVIDTLRCAHSIGIGDLDGDGKLEVVAGEHDPLWPYRQRCRLFVYKAADAEGLTWKRYVVDDRFEHHDGTKVVELTPGKAAIISHGWRDNIYVNVWEQPE